MNIEMLRNDVVKYLTTLGVPKKVLDIVCIQYYEFEIVEKILRKFKNIETIMEIGSYVGVSTFLLSHFCHNIISIDPDLDIEADCRKYNEHGQGNVRRYFSQVIEHFNIKNCITFDNYFSKTPRREFIDFHKPYDSDLENIPLFSLKNLDDLPKVDAVFLDGDHYWDGVMSDLLKITQFKKPPLLIFLHDVKGKWGKEIRKGVKEFQKINNHYDELKTIGNIGYLFLKGEL